MEAGDAPSPKKKEAEDPDHETYLAGCAWRNSLDHRHCHGEEPDDTAHRQPISLDPRVVGSPHQDEEEKPGDQADGEERCHGEHLLGRLRRVLDIEAKAFQRPDHEIKSEDYEAAREDPDEPLEDGEGGKGNPGERAQRKHAHKRRSQKGPYCKPRTSSGDSTAYHGWSVPPRGRFHARDGAQALARRLPRDGPSAPDPRRYTPISARIRPLLTAACSVSKSRSFWSAYARAKSAIALSKTSPLPR